MPISIGVLALQGGYKEVAAALLRQPGVVPSFVRTSQELRGVAALVIPGGESTTIGRLLELSALLEPLREFARSHPVFGICAGLIVLSDALAPAPGGAGAGGGADADSGDPTTTEQQQAPSPLVGGLDITISRNHFGRQSRSAFRQLVLTAAGRAAGVSTASYFIRAPAVVRVGAGVEVLAEVVAGDSVATVAVAVRAGHLLGVAFHPEVHNDDSYIRFFVRELCGFTPTAADAALRPSVPFVAPPMVSVGTPTTPATAAVAAQPPSTTSATTSAVKRAFPVFQQGGVIMDVVNPEQARIAEAAGAVSVMALERIPADIKRDGGLARMSDPALILGIRAAVSIPVMAKARIGHFAEARVLEALDVDCVDESEVLTPADETHHIDKRGFRIPFVCGAKSLGEALRRIAEGASMIRLKGNAGTGNVVQAVRHARQVFAEIRQLQGLRADEVFVFAKEHRVPVALVEQVRAAGRLPVVTFAAGGLATPADVSLLMHLGCDGVFVGSGIFKGENPAERARAMVQACAHFQDARVVARVSTNLGKAMVGLLDNGERYAAMGVNSDSLL